MSVPRFPRNARVLPPDELRRGTEMAEITRLGEPKKADSLSITPANEVTDDVQPTTTYIIALMNLSTRWTCIQISFDKQSWSATPLVGQTCGYPATDEGLNRCFNERKYQPIATINCGQGQRVWLKFRNPQGDVGTLDSPYEFFADCHSAGKVLVFTD
jgi:hypothetical protein